MAEVCVARSQSGRARKISIWKLDVQQSGPINLLAFYVFLSLPGHVKHGKNSGGKKCQCGDFVQTRRGDRKTNRGKYLISTLVAQYRTSQPHTFICLNFSFRRVPWLLPDAAWNIIRISLVFFAVVYSPRLSPKLVMFSSRFPLPLLAKREQF